MIIAIPSEATVPLLTGPPTKEELLVYYPAHFTWSQLKIFINAGDLGLLKRDKNLHKRYQEWGGGIIKEYGSIVNYLTNHRLQWGQPDRLSKIPSSLELHESFYRLTPEQEKEDTRPEYFTSSISPKWVSIIQNDWPYSVPPEIEHSLIWTLSPIFHPSLIHPSISTRIELDGLSGFTGLSAASPPPSPSLLPTALPALAEWGMTMDDLIISKTDLESAEGRQNEEYVRKAGEEVHEYVKMLWREQEWETAWFVNPPRLQSVPGLAHVHVFARRKIQN